MTEPRSETGPHLHVVALNDDFATSTTFLSRETGDAAPDLTALARALDLPGLDSRQLELFPVADLGDMRLSDYIANAFAPKGPISADTRARLNAIEGQIALLLDPAIPTGAAPRSGPRARLIASLPLEPGDHTADLPRADLTPQPAPEDAEPVVARFNANRATYWRDHAWLAAIAMALGMAVLWVMGNPHVWTGAIGGLFAVAVRAFYLASDEATAEWVLTETALKGPGGRHVRLADIDKLRTLGSAVQIVTRTGDKHLLKYVADRPAVVARIERAMAGGR
ncbi:hypothetical protein [Nioella halotolerans]|uniref:hypothetical protein n=1 Tax=Nioella halotolerans TaxID=2303578 RepID=UPI002685AB12